MLLTNVLNIVKRLNNMERDNRFTQKLKSKYCIKSKLLNKIPFTLRYVSQYSNTYNRIAQLYININFFWVSFYQF